MIKLENTEVMGFEAAIRGMRNPMNSWDRSDSRFDCSVDENGDCLNYEYINCDDCTGFKIGTNDHSLMMKLVAGGSVHAKYRRMITVYVDITAPMYWWKEFDTYKVGTVANSCSTMHKIHEKEFTLDDFSCEHLMNEDTNTWLDGFEDVVLNGLNDARDKFIKTKDKCYWWQMIQLLPSSYNQKRTVMLNYEVLSNIYESRKNHKLDEWSIDFIDWIKSLPYSELITGEGI
jgi:hypothetical protein